MKICMIGLGSIGKRHIKNLNQILTERKVSFTIDALRSRRSNLSADIQELIQDEYDSYEQLSNNYDIIFITNPTSKHYETIQAVSHKTKAMFIEKPLFENNNYKLEKLHLSEEGIYYVACPLRHKAIIQYVKRIIAQGENVYSVRAISTSYLPEWRQGVDYRMVYSARKVLGGGVTLDLIHEWDYLSYLFGMPKKVYNIQGKYSNLETDCEDISIYIADYGDKTVEVHLDYIGRFPERKMELFCKDYRIDVDLLNNKIIYCGNKDAENKVILFEQEDLYQNEMNYFIDIIEKKQLNENTIEHAKQVLSLALHKDNQ